MRCTPLVALVMLAACGGSSPRPQTGPAPSSPALLAAAGDQAAATVFLRPDRWSALQAAVLEAAGSMLPARLRRALQASTPWEAFRRANPRRARRLPAAIDGLDRSRPIVVSLADGAEAGLLEALSSVVHHGGPGLVHRAVVPASNGSRLRRSLVDVLNAFGCREQGASRYACRGRSVRLQRGPTYITVQFGTAHAQTRSAKPAAPVMTPALGHAFEAQAPVSVHVRPYRWRQVQALRLSRTFAEALHAAVGSKRLEIMFAGLAELTDGYRRLSPVGSEFDDASVALRVQPGLGVTAVAGLTEYGQAVYAAGRADSAPSSRSRGAGRGALVRVRSPLDLRAMHEQAGIPFGYGGLDSKSELTRALRRCGPTCRLHLMVSRPFAAQNLIPGGLWKQFGVAGRDAVVTERTSLPGDRILDVQIDLPAVIDASGMPDRWASPLKRLGPWVARAARRGRTVRFTAGFQDALAPMPPAELAHRDPGPTGPASKRTKATACLQRVGRAVAEAVQTLSVADRRMRASSLVGAGEEMRSDLTCALSSGATREQAREYERLLTDLGLALQIAAQEAANEEDNRGQGDAEEPRGGPERQGQPE